MENEVVSKTLILKYFGSKETLGSNIKSAVSLNVKGFNYTVEESFSDYKITLNFENVFSKDYSLIIRKIIGELKDNFYAEEDMSLSEKLFNYLKVKNVKVSVAESFTGGRVVSSIISNSGASEFVMEGIVAYSNQSKVDRLFVSEKDIIKEGAVSSVVAYQMALGLLKKGNCDLAISTTGIAGPHSDNTNKPVGLCYIGIGGLDEIHTYKLNLSGNREEITETAKNYALFLAINKLKKI